MRITALMFVTMIAAAWSSTGSSRSSACPDRPPEHEDVFGSIEVDYKLALNAIAALVFCALFWLTARRGATDPVCGMTVDRGKALTATVGGPATSSAASTARACSRPSRSATSRNRRAAIRPRPLRFELGAERQQRGLVRGAAYELNRQRQPLRGEAGGNGRGRLTGHVPR